MLTSGLVGSDEGAGAGPARRAARGGERPAGAGASRLPLELWAPQIPSGPARGNREKHSLSFIEHEKGCFGFPAPGERAMENQ